MTLPMTENPSMDSKYPNSSRNNLNNQENLNVKVKKKRNRQKAANLSSEDKAAKKRQTNRLRILNETPEQRELRLKKLREYKESRTPEQKEASRLKNALYTRRYRQEKLDSAQTPEEREIMIQERKEYSRKYREKLKSLAKTPEEKEALRIKLVIEKRRSVAKLRKLPDRDCKGRLLTPEEIQSQKMKVIIKDEETSLLCLKKRWQATEKMREYRRKMKTMGQLTASSADQLPRNRIKEIASNFPIAVDEIKVEQEVLQEIIIKTIPSIQNANLITSMQNEVPQGISWSLYEPSSASYMTYNRTKRRSFIDEEHFVNTISHSSKIERRKIRVDKSINCMRELIKATAKGDSFATFGKCIAQKLSTSKKGVAEANIAKLLIDKVLQNLAIGFYSFDNHYGN